MKKILLALTAAVSCAFFAKADGIYNFMGFESLTAGNVLDANKDDAGGTGNAYWSYAANGGITECVVSNYDGNAYQLYGEGNEALGQNENAPGNNYLNVEASEAKLFRNVNFDGAAEAIGSGLYFDSLVQFSATDQSPELDADLDKLVVWLYGGDEDSTLFGPTTNLVVTAAFLGTGNTVTPSNYVVSVSGVSVMPGEWHRLTIKAIEDIGTTDIPASIIPGFVVFIDGVVATCADAKGEEGSLMGALNATAASWNDRNALFPSLIKASASQNAQTITAVGFDGSGAIDDVCFTSTAPSFAADGMFFTLNWSVGVQTMTINGDAVTVDPALEGSTNITVAAAGATYAVAVTAANGYSGSTYTATNGVSVSGTTFTVNGTGSGTITMTPAFFMIGDTPYASFAAALAAARDGAGNTVKVAANVALTEGSVVSLEYATDDIVLDLCGHEITTSDSQYPVIMVTAGTLKIIDSVGGGKITSSQCQDGDVFNMGTLIWGAVEGDQGAKLDGLLFNMPEMGVCSIVRGSFDATLNGLSDLELNKAEGTVITSEGNYYVAAPGEQVQKLTITSTNVTYTVTINEAAAASGAEIKNGDVIVITATPDANYEYATEPAGWTLSNGVITQTITVVGDDSVNVTIPAPTSTEPPAPSSYTLTLTSITNATVTYKIGDAAAVDYTEAVTVEKDAAVVVTATAAEGYTYQGVDLTNTGWSYDDVNNVITFSVQEMIADVTQAVPAPKLEEAPPVSEYPTYITGIEDAEVKAAYQAKYNTWKDANGADTNSAYEDEFLLNIAPNAADKTLKPVSITIGADGKVAIAANQALASVNGKVYVKSATTLAGLSTAEWVEATLDQGVIKVTPGASDTAGFYKIKVDF